MSPESLDRLVRDRFPSFLAHAYQRWAEAREPSERLRWALRWQDLLTRLLTLVATQQYLLLDRDTHSDPRLNQLLLQRFPLATPDIWAQLLFALLEAYEEQPGELFMPELHRLAWAPATDGEDPSPGFKRRREVQGHLDRLVQIGLEWRHLGEAELPDLPQLADEASRLLELLLPEVAFLADYALVEEPAPDGRMMIYRHDGEGLPLHPLAVPGGTFGPVLEEPVLEEPAPDEPVPDEPMRGEIGLYHRFTQHSLRFLLALSGTESTGEQWANAFVQLIFDSIRRVKQREQRTAFLTWWHLKEVTQDITRARTASARSRYSRRLYLPRRQAQEAFEAFLASPQRCFVLLGPSGVGKSSFLLHFEERVRADRDDLAVLIYEGGNLDPDRSVSALIAQDLRDRVSFETDGDDPLWARLEQLEGAAAQEGRRLVLCIDGLNESPNAAAVLEHLDQIVRRPWPCLKVVITSRPETWRGIRRGLRLAEALYFQPAASADSLPGPFEASTRLRPFSAEELPEVFAKYREAYDLETSDEELLLLSADQRRLLCEPLNLALAARNHRGEALAEVLEPQILIRDHLGSLQREGVLYPRDLEFLEQRLMPRFAARGDWRNVLRPEDLDLPEQPELFEAVFSDQKLADGRTANQSFRNLVDSALLIRREQGGPPEIVFRYERFFEYFAARHLRRSVAPEARAEHYLHLTQRLEHHPFLWGALRLALLEELEEGRLELALELCRSPLPQARSLALTALVDVDRSHRPGPQAEESPVSDNPVDEALAQLLPRFRWSREAIASSSAVELAARTGRLEPLRRAALQSGDELRRHAVYHSYLLWRRRPERGLELLESITSAATRYWLPRPGPLEAVVSLALLIFFDSREQPETRQRLRETWRRLCRHLLRVKVAEGEARWRTAVRRLRTEVRLRLLAKLLMRLIGEFPDGNAFNRSDLERSLPVPPKEAEVYRRLLSHHRPDLATDFEEIRRDLLAASTSDHLLVGRAAALVLMVWLNHDSERWHPVMEEILQRALERDEPSQWVDLVCLAGGLTLDHRNHHSDALYRVFSRALDAYQTHYRDHPRVEPMERDYSRHNYFGGDILFHYLRTGDAVSPVLRRHLEDAAARQDQALLRALLSGELLFVAVHSRRPAAAFDALEEILHHTPEALRPDLDEPLRRLLEGIHRFFPEEVETFVQESPDLEALALDLRSQRRPWDTGAVFGWKCARFLRDNLLMESSEIRHRIVGILEQATRCNQLSDWLDYAVREAVNVAYGADVLPQRQGAAPAETQEGAQP